MVRGIQRIKYLQKGEFVPFFALLEISSADYSTGLCGLIVACVNIRQSETVQLRGRIHLYRLTLIIAPDAWI
jgi:hypothetical protein